MKPLSTDEKIRNVLVLQALMLDVPDVQITKWLHTWECGSTHCVGGWVAVCPYFRREYGVRPRHDGAPISASLGIDGAFDLAVHLFGASWMFDGSAATGRPDRAVINERIHRRLDELAQEP